MEIENLLGGLLDHLNEVPEPRQSGKIAYPLDEILFLTISAVISGCSEWDEIVDFGEDKLEWLRKYRPCINGIPAHDTVNCLFRSNLTTHFAPNVTTLSSLSKRV